MELNYFLDLQHLCDVNPKNFDTFFRFVFDVVRLSKSYNVKEITESFFRDDDNNFNNYTHRSKQPLFNLIFSGNDELHNRIIPNLWSCFTGCNPDSLKFGPFAEDTRFIYPNARFCTEKNNLHPWNLSEIGHYHFFRNYHLLEKVYSSECDDFIPLYIPNCPLTKSALTSFKKLGRDDRSGVMSDLKKLNDFISNEWTNGEFPIDSFAKNTGVDASDESETTKNNPKLNRQRRFSIPGIGSIYCFLHIKVSNTYRIHFYPDSKTRKAHIAYVGPHLKTSTNR